MPGADKLPRLPQARREKKRAADAHKNDGSDSEDEAAFRADWHMSRADEVGGRPILGSASVWFCSSARKWSVPVVSTRLTALTNQQDVPVTEKGGWNELQGYRSIKLCVCL